MVSLCYMMRKKEIKKKHLNIRRQTIVKFFLAINKMIASTKALFLTVRIPTLPNRTRQGCRKKRRFSGEDRQGSKLRTEVGKELEVRETEGVKEKEGVRRRSGALEYWDTRGNSQCFKFSKFYRNPECFTDDVTSAPDYNNNILHLSIHASTNSESGYEDCIQDRSELQLLIEAKLYRLQGIRFQLDIEESQNSELFLFILHCLAEVGTDAEISKLSLHFAEIEKLNYLRLCLTTRLAKIESQIESTLDLNLKLELYKKQKRLTEQVYEAWQLSLFHKRREKILRTILGKYFEEGFLRLFDRTLEQKVIYVRRSREVADMISLMEEQMDIMKQSGPASILG